MKQIETGMGSGDVVEDMLLPCLHLLFLNIIMFYYNALGTEKTYK